MARADGYVLRVPADRRAALSEPPRVFRRCGWQPDVAGGQGFVEGNGVEHGRRTRAALSVGGRHYARVPPLRVGARALRRHRSELAGRRHAGPELPGVGVAALRRSSAAAWLRLKLSRLRNALTTRASSPLHVRSGWSDGHRTWTMVRRKQSRVLGSSRVYKWTIRGRQNGNPG